MRILFLEFDARVDASGAVRRFYFCSKLGYNHPQAAAFYEARIGEGAMQFEERFPVDLWNANDVESGAGYVQLINTDGALDDLPRYGYGTEAQLWYGAREQAPSARVAVFNGLVDRIETSREVLTVYFKSRDAELDQPFMSATFLGTNQASTGVEGLEADIKGQLKPRLVGSCRNISPQLVQSSILTYAWNYRRDGTTAPSSAPTAYRVGADPYATINSAVTTQAALEAASPAAGTVTPCAPESLLRLGTKPNLPMTMDVASSVTALRDIIPFLLQDAGVSLTRYDASGMTALGDIANYTAGMYVREEMNTRSVINRFLSSVGARLTHSPLGVYRVQMLTAPTDTPLYRLKSRNGQAASDDSELDMVSLDVVSASELVNPAYAVELRYDQNFTPMRVADFAGIVTAANREPYIQPSRSVIKENAARVQFPNAVRRVFETYLTQTAQAESQAVRFLSLFGSRRQQYTALVRADISVATALKLGVTVSVVDSRFGLKNGKNAVVIYRKYDAMSELLTLTIME
jgi:hypothetical protein